MLLKQVIPLLVAIGSAAVLRNGNYTSSHKPSAAPSLTTSPLTDSFIDVSSNTVSLQNGTASITVAGSTSTQGTEGSTKATDAEVALATGSENMTITTEPKSTSQPSLELSNKTIEAEPVSASEFQTGSNATEAGQTPEPGMSNSTNATDTDQTSSPELQNGTKTIDAEPASGSDFQNSTDATEPQESSATESSNNTNSTEAEPNPVPSAGNGTETSQAEPFQVSSSQNDTNLDEPKPLSVSGIQNGTNETDSEPFSTLGVKEPIVKANNSLIIDAFNDTSINALGFYHGVSGNVKIGDFDETNGGSQLKVSTGDVDASFLSSLAEGCSDYSAYGDHYVHIRYNGSAKFSVSLQQHNKDCDDAKLPFPQTWDSVQASRYSSEDKQDIYIPLSHFNVDLQKVNGIALESWYTNDTTYVNKIEMLPPSAIPSSVSKVKKLDTGTLHVGCSQPNLIAFGIDDGSPEYMQETLGIIKEEQIPVTFFVQGKALQLGPEEGANFTAGYREMIDAGHQIALHTMSHPHMEAVQDEKEIEKQITDNIEIVKNKLEVESQYFRPPFGTVGSRTRQAVARHIKDPKQVMWSIDVKDWMYGIDPDGDPGRKQYEAFKESLNKGGDIVVLHYLYKSTVDQFRDMIKLAKSQGRQFVRVDQCIGDPNAPNSWGWKNEKKVAG